MYQVVMDLMKPNKKRKLKSLTVLAMLIVSGCNSSLKQQATVEHSDDAHYIIRDGDTLVRIAKQNNTPLATLVAANNIAPPYDIHVGDVLRVPLGVSATRIWPSPRRPLGAGFEQQPSIEKAVGQLQPMAQIEGVHYVVGAGDSLSGIASRHHLSIADLIAVNGIDPPYQIHPGQGLIIPPSEKVLQQKAQNFNESREQEAIEVLPSPPLSSYGFLWPVKGTVIRNFEENNVVGESGAINIAASIGSPVHATNNGIVAFVGKLLDRYGQMVVLRHADGYVSLYAHVSALHINEGDMVHRGQLIAEVGNSGDVIDGQLRFEMRQGLQPIDPALVLAKQRGGLLGFL